MEQQTDDAVKDDAVIEDVVVKKTTVAEVLAQFQSFRWKPAGGMLVILPFAEAELTESGLVIPEESREKPHYGLVLTTGPDGVSSQTGSPIPVFRSRGELVMYGQYSGLAMPRLDGWQVYLLQDQQALLWRDEPDVELVFHADKKTIHESNRICADCPQARISAPERLAKYRALAGMDAPEVEIPPGLAEQAAIARAAEQCEDCPHPVGRHGYTGCLELGDDGKYCPCKETYGTVDPVAGRG